eukprot:3464294-Prymnesium_polylepis.1
MSREEWNGHADGGAGGGVRTDDADAAAGTLANEAPCFSRRGGGGRGAGGGRGQGLACGRRDGRVGRVDCCGCGRRCTGEQWRGRL